MTSHHAEKRSLSPAQLAVLRRIGDGSPDGVFEGCAHRQSARALERAKERFREDARARALDEQVAAWQRAAVLRQFADALGGTDDSPEAAEWTAWIRQRADTTDPTSRPVRAPVVADPTDDELAPYLGLSSGWAVASQLEP